jgi:4-hydroxybutyryl-CoA dehydratase/vinylacetyl-CoA-Delta-isomerase
MMTGEQYRESVRDGRATYYLGKRVDDLTADPDLGKVVDLVAAGYDRWYQPGPDARHPLMSPPRSVAEMKERIPLFAELDTLTDVTYGCMGTLVTAAGRLRDEHPEMSDRILAYVEGARRLDIRATECITDAKGNRSLKPSAQEDPDQYLHVVDRGPDGVVIRGAKLHITDQAHASRGGRLLDRGHGPGLVARGADRQRGLPTQDRRPPRPAGVVGAADVRRLRHLQ